MTARPGRVALAVVVACWLVLLSWRPLTSDTGALLAAAGVVALVGAVGVVARRAGAAQGAVAAAQVGSLAVAGLVGVAAAEGPGSWTRIPELLASTLPQLVEQAAPLRPDLGLTLGICLVVGIVAVVADALAVGRGSPGWATVPLLTLYLVPALGLTRDMPAVFFALLAASVGLVLYASGEHQRTPGRRDAATRGVALATASGLVGASVLLTLATPVTISRPRGQEPIQMSDPSLDLKRNLTQGSSDPIIWYTTDRPTGSYLRLVSLPLFDEAGFHLTDVRVSGDALPDPPGLTRPVEGRTTQIEIGEFASEWLPLPWAPRTVDAGEDWGHVSGSLDVLALGFAGRTEATRGLSYEVTSVDVRPTDAQVSDATAGEVADDRLTLDWPSALSADLGELTAEVTAGAASDGRRALLIEEFLSSEAFTYSTRPGPGTGIASLEDFLLRSRTGYCEQFAGAMATMARQVGIPSRIAVGFTPGRRDDDGRWEVSARDMHAWPELFFEEWGWVAFEPTPASGVPSVGEGAEEPEPAPPTATPSAEPTVEPTEAPVEQPVDEPGIGGVPARTLLGWAAVAAGLALLGATPRLVRALRRRRRFAAGQDARAAALGAWAEARDGFVDLGRAWPAGSPRHVVAGLGAAGAPLAGLAVQAERALYADPEAAPAASGSVVTGDGWRDAVETALRGVRASASGRDRWLAAWWPRSWWGPGWTALRDRLGGLTRLRLRR